MTENVEGFNCCMEATTKFEGSGFRSVKDAYHRIHLLIQIYENILRSQISHKVAVDQNQEFKHAIQLKSIF